MIFRKRVAFPSRDGHGADGGLVSYEVNVSEQFRQPDFPVPAQDPDLVF
jgi:hypothetical protein